MVSKFIIADEKDNSIFTYLIMREYEGEYILEYCDRIRSNTKYQADKNKFYQEQIKQIQKYYEFKEM